MFNYLRCNTDTSPTRNDLILINASSPSLASKGRLRRSLSNDTFSRADGNRLFGHDSPFNSNVLASNTTLLPLELNNVAISLAASSFLRAKKPLFVRMASPISSADRASPWALTMMDC